MITKKVFYVSSPYTDVMQLLLNCPAEIINHIPKTHSYYITGGIRVGIISVNNGTRITISRRSERENINTFLQTIISIEKKISELSFKQKHHSQLLTLDNPPK